MPVKKSTNRRRPSSRRRSGKKSAPKTVLRIVLQVLVVLLLLALIAFAASYVYLKKQDKDRINTPIEDQSIAIVDQDGGMAAEQKTAAITLLEGTWVSEDNGAMLSFLGDQYVIDFPSYEAEEPMKGAFDVSGERIRLLNSSASNCKSFIGTYNFRKEDEKLHISLRQDSCNKRSNLLVASWYKL